MICKLTALLEYLYLSQNNIIFMQEIFVWFLHMKFILQKHKANYGIEQEMLKEWCTLAIVSVQCLFTIIIYL